MKMSEILKTHFCTDDIYLKGHASSQLTIFIFLYNTWQPPAVYSFPAQYTSFFSGKNHAHNNHIFHLFFFMTCQGHIK